MKQIASLQIMRGLAAVLVVGCHAIAAAGFWSDYSDAVLDFARHLGKIGVYLFFVISGFIMVHTSWNRFGAWSSGREFLWRRLVRVVPLYWIATSIEVLLRGIQHTAPSSSAVIHSLFFVPQGVEPGPGAQMMPVLFLGWTLNYEMMFYVIFAACLALPRRAGLAALGMSMIAIVVAGTFLKPLSDTAAPTTVLTFWSDPTILLFLLGALIGIGFDSVAHSNPRVLFGLRIALGVVAALLLAIPIMSVGYPLTIAWRTVVWLLCVLSIALAVFDAGGLRSRWSAAAEKLGDASYSIYLFHFFVVVAFSKLWTMAFGHVFSVGFIAGAIVIATAVGVAIHQLVERPLIEAFKGRRQTHSGAVALNLSAHG